MEGLGAPLSRRTSRDLPEEEAVRAAAAKEAAETVAEREAGAVTVVAAVAGAAVVEVLRSKSCES
jgi:hypothetical protein